ncbi:MAG: MMPL family transporter [Propionicimonas sp.]|nr:MMPL family transporter [Propionicimonas sp.]
MIKQQEAGLAANQQQLDAARADLEAKQQHVAGGLAKLAGDITDLEQEIEALIKDQGEDSEAVADARTKLAGLEAQQQELQGQADQLAAGLQALAQQQQELDAGAKQLAQARAEAEAGLQQLQAARAALEASQAEIDANRAELNSGKQQIAAGRAELAAGQAEIDANRAKINDGKQQIAAGRKKLAAGQAELDANREKINDGRRQIEEARQKLVDASAEIADGDVKLAEGRQELLDGEADLSRGERQLALTSGLRMVSEAGDVAVSRIQFTEPIEGVSADTKAAITDLGATLAAVGVTVDYSTQISASTFAFGSEGAGLAVAGLILLVMLGSLLAAGLPLITGLVGVGTGLLGVVAATHWVELTEFTPILALMLGLAVGIDYALFLVNRHRHQLVQGTDLVESIGLATGTAGSAVVVAGLTVTVAVGALTLTGIPFLGALGIAAAATVLLTVLVAITLTPALLRLIGHRVLSPKGRRKLAAKQAAAGESQPAASSVLATGAKHDRGWGRFVTRHPIPVMLAATAILGLIAVPAASLRLGLPDGSNEPQDSTAFRAYTLISENFGVGENAAMIAVAKLPEATASALDSDGFTDLQLDIAERLRATPGVAYVVPAMTSDNQQTVVFQIVPTTGPSDDATVDLVNALRDQRDGIIADTGISSLGFAGQTVANIDMSERLAEALPGYLAVVVGISLVLLLLVFRSLLVPLLATGGFLLTIAAAFGAVVAVYQWGWLGTVFQVTHPGPILSFLPTLVIGITFGLAMDYQMFLVTGMRESWAHGEDARTAVRSGFSHGAKVITAAALIMASVFASFVYSHMTVVRPVGFALAIGVLFDAFVVRMTIMPALMHLLGEKAWYLPRWLDRILPNLDVEGTKLLAANHSSTADSSGGTERPDPA